MYPLFWSATANPDQGTPANPDQGTQLNQIKVTANQIKVHS
nr:hypothetical protein [Mycoplasmopsis bovis]